MSIIAALRYPELVEAITRDGGQGARTDAARCQVRQGEKRTQYLIIEGRLDAVAKGIDADFSEAFAAATPELKEALDPSRAQAGRRDRALSPRGARRGRIGTTTDGLQRLEARAARVRWRRWARPGPAPTCRCSACWNCASTTCSPACGPTWAPPLFLLGADPDHGVFRRPRHRPAAAAHRPIVADDVRRTAATTPSAPTGTAPTKSAAWWAPSTTC